MSILFDAHIPLTHSLSYNQFAFAVTTCKAERSPCGHGGPLIPVACAAVDAVEVLSPSAHTHCTLGSTGSGYPDIKHVTIHRSRTTSKSIPQGSRWHWQRSLHSRLAALSIKTALRGEPNLDKSMLDLTKSIFTCLSACLLVRRCGGGRVGLRAGGGVSS